MPSEIFNLSPEEVATLRASFESIKINAREIGGRAWRQ